MPVCPVTEVRLPGIKSWENPVNTGSAEPGYENDMSSTDIPAGADRSCFSSWSSTGSAGYRDGREEEYVVAKHEEYPNLCGCYMDDPLGQFEKYPEEQRTQMAKEFVTGIRRKLDACSRPMDIIVTWYPYVAREDDGEVYKDADGIAIYTWNALDLEKLDTVMVSAKEMFPDKKIYLGAYLYDYDRSFPLTAEQMEYQCERGKQWLLDGTIAGMIFVTNAVMAPGMKNDIWLRDWIKKNGDIDIP